MFIHDTDYMCVVIVRVRSGQEEYIQLILLSGLDLVLCGVWFERQQKIDELYIYSQIFVIILY